MRIICFGDSNTWGYDPRSYIGEQYPRNVRWQGRLAALPGLDVVNCGVNGRSIPNTPARISAACAEIGRYLPAETLVVMLGGNDLLSQPDFCAEDVAERMESFLRVALSELAPARTLLVSPPPMRPGAWVGEGRLVTESQRLGACLAETARELGIDFADAAEWDPACTSLSAVMRPFSRACAAHWAFKCAGATNPLFIFAARRGILYCHYLKEVSAWARTI